MNTKDIRAVAVLYADESGGRWVTIGAQDGDGGTPVFIDDAGNIQKGPEGLAGQNVASIKKRVPPGAIERKQAELTHRPGEAAKRAVMQDEARKAVLGAALTPQKFMSDAEIERAMKRAKAMTGERRFPTLPAPVGGSIPKAAPPALEDAMARTAQQMQASPAATETAGEGGMGSSTIEQRPGEPEQGAGKSDHAAAYRDLFDRAKDLTDAELAAGLERLDDLGKDELLAIAKDQGIAKRLPSRKAAMEELARRVTQRRDTYERVKLGVEPTPMTRGENAIRPAGNPQNGPEGAAGAISGTPDRGKIAKAAEVFGSIRAKMAGGPIDFATIRQDFEASTSGLSKDEVHALASSLGYNLKWQSKTKALEMLRGVLDRMNRSAQQMTVIRGTGPSASGSVESLHTDFDRLAKGSPGEAAAWASALTSKPLADLKGLAQKLGLTTDGSRADLAKRIGGTLQFVNTSHHQTSRI